MKTREDATGAPKQWPQESVHCKPNAAAPQPQPHPHNAHPRYTPLTHVPHLELQVPLQLCRLAPQPLVLLLHLR